MKKAIPFIIIGGILNLALIVAMGCFIIPWLGDIHPDFLTSHDWNACYGNMACQEIIDFGEYGDFYHYCGCGEPVRDFDLYQLYSYDRFSGDINLYGYGITKMKVLFHNSEYLFIEYDDGTFRPFTNENAKDFIFEPDVIYQELSTAPLCTNILDYKDNMLTILPSAYEGTANGEYGGEDYRAPVSDDVTVITIRLAKRYGEEICESTEISLGEALTKNEKGFTEAYVNINDDGEIDKIIIYNSTVTEG